VLGTSKLRCGQRSDILEAVAETLFDHTEIDHLQIMGHTENVGNPAKNLLLS
jgi:outer membrane protein OmpA-like peptidoglycan-associated protein